MTNDNAIPDNVEILSQSLEKPIVLIGMMGAGKSHIGHKLAGLLKVPFHDSDKVIEEKAGRSVSDIFEEFGEEKFRASEKSTILELLEAGPCVIATGGGAVTNPELLEAVKSASTLVWLKADVASIMKRLEGNTTRPLLQTDDPAKTLADLLEQREPLYTQAQIVVDTAAEPLHRTLETLINELYEHLIPGRV